MSQASTVRLFDGSRDCIETSNSLHPRMTVEMTSEGNEPQTTWTFFLLCPSFILLRTSYAPGCQIPGSITKVPMYRSILDLSKSNPDPASSAEVALKSPGNGIGLHNVASVFLLGKRRESAGKAYLRVRLFAECSPNKTGYVDGGGGGRNVPCRFGPSSLGSASAHRALAFHPATEASSMAAKHM